MACHPSRLLLHATLALGFPASLSPLDLQNGPWMVLQPDGGARVAIELATSPGDDQAAGIRLVRQGSQDSEDSGSRPSVMPFSRRSGSSSILVVFDLPASARKDYACILGDGRRLPLPSLMAPVEDAPARLALVTAANYPTAIDIERMATVRGHAPGLVLLIGDRLESVLGTGGWENRYPVAVIDQPGTRTADLSAAAGRLQWGPVFSWGCLSLLLAPSSEMAGLAFTQVLRPWRVLLMPQACWRLDDLTKGEPVQLTTLLALCQPAYLSRVPLILAAGNGCSFVSDPLTLASDQQVMAAAGGTRYVGLDCAGGVIHRLTPLVAHLERESGWLVLNAERERLDLIMITRTRDRAWGLAWDPWPACAIPEFKTRGVGGVLDAWRDQGKAAESAGCVVNWMNLQDLPLWGAEARSVQSLLSSVAMATEPGLDMKILQTYPWPAAGSRLALGWGLGNAAPLAGQLTEASPPEKRQAAIDTLRMLALPGWAQNVRGEQEFRALSDALLRQEDSLPLLDRLFALNPDLGLNVSASADLPEKIRTDLALRALSSDISVKEPRLARLILASQDAWLMQALLPYARGRQGIAMTEVIRDRMTVQAQGRLPLDADPLVQHALAAAVFDSPFLSPTPLRPLALTLRKRLHPLACQPLERFLARHGEARQINR